MLFRRRKRKDGGAALVEFAFIMPLLVLLLVGIVEFGWGVAQQIDIRHKARETLRLAIVDEPVGDIKDRACETDIIASTDITEILLTTGADQGSEISVVIRANIRQLSGLFSAFWGPTPMVSSEVVGRVEQESTFIPGLGPGSVDLALC